MAKQARSPGSAHLISLWSSSALAARPFHGEHSTSAVRDINNFRRLLNIRRMNASHTASITCEGAPIYMKLIDKTSFWCHMLHSESIRYIPQANVRVCSKCGPFKTFRPVTNNKREHRPRINLCPQCLEGILQEKSWNRSREYKGRSYNYMETGVYCDCCKERFLDYDKREESDWIKFCEEIDGKSSAMR